MVGWLALLLLYGAVLAVWMRYRPSLEPGLSASLYWVIPLGFAAALGPALARFRAVFLGHAQDSLFTLVPWAIAILVAIAICLSVLAWALAVAVALRLRCWAGRKLWRRLFAGAANLALIPPIYASLLSLLPQLYYQFYRPVIPGLPQQWVLRSPLDWDPFWNAIALQPGAGLSEVLTGVVFWSFFLPSLLMHLCPPRPAMRGTRDQRMPRLPT